MATTTPSTGPSTTTLLTATAATALTAFTAYAIYFDYKRRHDVAFRRNLKKESKRQAKEAKEAEGAQQKQEKEELRRMVEEAVDEGWPSGAEEKESYFMEEVGMGERLCNQGESF